MSILDMAMPAIKPLIKPAFEQAEKDIIKALEKVQTGCEDGEVLFILAKRDDKLIIAPAVVADDNSIQVAPDITATLLEPQPIVPYIISNFNKAVAKK